eukprot:CAMPEP_0118681720 /NCGR_PEP_ID=MMETSP0800-20121206/5093_1 /TAXON_ID=210618 ORGANISM="Striatella unipunctata, Strain CCMP2910" /NCGR_SAMPLE_ID=MMETSP0800 /ASSEMBLY_ACC=CAM_ASM_000638 /LENGTH=43 /DNA_ID= /DNA_START= /DNA_END= /DNA_ORIENTATION=
MARVNEKQGGMENPQQSTILKIHIKGDLEKLFESGIPTNCLLE